jgi:hypothetical protein
MTYEEYERFILNNFKNSIYTTDELEKTKLFLMLKKWYVENYKNEIKKYFEKNEIYNVYDLSTKFSYVCTLSDIEKVFYVENEKKIEELSTLSKEVFLLVQEYVNKKSINFTEEDYKKYYDRAKIIIENSEPLLKKIFETDYSEMILDLDYLLKKGNVDAYSFRTSRFLT